MIQLARRQSCCTHMSEHSASAMTVLTRRKAVMPKSLEGIGVGGISRTPPHMKQSRSGRWKHIQSRCFSAGVQGCKCQSEIMWGVLDKGGAHHADIGIIREPGVLHQDDCSNCPPAVTAHDPVTWHCEHPLQAAARVCSIVSALCPRMIHGIWTVTPSDRCACKLQVLNGKDWTGGNMFSWVCLHAADAKRKQSAPCCASCGKEELKDRSASAEIAGAALQDTTQQHEALSGGMQALRLVPCISCMSHGTHNAMSTQTFLSTRIMAHAAV